MGAILIRFALRGSIHTVGWVAIILSQPAHVLAFVVFPNVVLDAIAWWLLALGMVRCRKTQGPSISTRRSSCGREPATHTSDRWVSEPYAWPVATGTAGEQCGGPADMVPDRGLGKRWVRT